MLVSVDSLLGHSGHVRYGCLDLLQLGFLGLGLKFKLLFSHRIVLNSFFVNVLLCVKKKVLRYLD